MQRIVTTEQLSLHQYVPQSENAAKSYLPRVEA